MENTLRYWVSDDGVHLGLLCIRKGKELGLVQSKEEALEILDHPLYNDCLFDTSLSGLCVWGSSGSAGCLLADLSRSEGECILRWPEYAEELEKVNAKKEKAKKALQKD